ncbi:MAG: hypothetical protein JWO84_101 [Parcubacteria group bacterium]|nr:hypothetical protein [Parcubacteria group bacterium]
MNRTTLLAVVLIVLIGVAVSFFLVHSQHMAITSGPNATTTPNLTGQAIFSDGEHGFTIRYLQSYETDYTFASFYHLPANWRAQALATGTGTPVIAIIGSRTQSDHSYPRYYDAEVRIGASSDPKEVARCLVPATDQGEQQLPDVTLGETSFKAFSFQDAAMMQYLKGVSYRTLHNGSCIAVEKLATGSSYADDPKSKDDIPQATLDQAYAALDAVVATFAFSTPS